MFGYEGTRRAIVILSVLSTAWVAPAAHAQKQGISQSSYEQFMQCLGVLHARTDMIHRLAERVSDPSYAYKLGDILGKGTRQLQSLQELVEKANPHLDQQAGLAAEQAARYQYDASYTRPASEQLDLFRQGHGDGDDMFSPECGALVEAMLSRV